MNNNLTPLTDTLIAVDVPENAEHFFVARHSKSLMYSVNDKADKCNLPPGSWEILCRAEEVTEEIAETFFEEHEFIEVDHRHAEYKKVPDLDRFQSLLRSKGIIIASPRPDYMNCKSDMNHNESVAKWEADQIKVTNPLLLKKQSKQS